MLLIAGLGNPGARHAKNRHNIGFMALEAIARAHRIGPFRARFQGLVAEGLIGAEPRRAADAADLHERIPAAASARRCASTSSTSTRSS